MVDSLPDITMITSDSRQVINGAMFVAISGAHHDGKAFIKAAVDKGAKYIVVGVGSNVGPIGNAQVIEVKNPRQFLAEAASVFYRTQPKNIVCVTGTNGKTSTVNFVRQIWEKLGERAASLGTLGILGPDIEDYSGMTTPDPVWLHARLSELADRNIGNLAMEASSIGIEQHRLDGVKVSAAAFTNITRDHLDYHGTMDKYFAAKLRLFTTLLCENGTAVLNADTEYFGVIKAECQKRKITCWGYGRKGDEIKLISREILPHGQKLSLKIFGENHMLELPLVGEFQAMNILCAIGLAMVGGKFKIAAILSAVEKISGVAGRLQLVKGAPTGCAVYVDYAHTPDALENILNALRPHAQNRLICLFGCGGDRDKGKRPQMGEISTRLADITIVTDDNPRSEDPGQIRKDILDGAGDGAINIGGRREAIREAVRMLQAGDILVLAGKGHEQGQIFATHTEHFDDVEEAESALGEVFA
ncbi:MAG: UDP-N-acetylmuramoyl-L-alanyl-D-glutamate--2,6-diaminopimelate ligase [Pseudobdellovibrionaceae bacterium]|nr:UDP-N-acetylmuramoyl-L-alanyl-D-glutamate--2,6-diaminopimelate ligase [Pseudobdellovibrionaceae bacterium]